MVGGLITRRYAGDRHVGDAVRRLMGAAHCTFSSKGSENESQIENKIENNNVSNNENCVENTEVNSITEVSWKSVVVALFNTLLPRGCAGCDFPDTVLCNKCYEEFASWQVASLSSSITGCRYSCAKYDGNVRRAILRWKDHDDVACDAIFGTLLSNLIVRVIREYVSNYSNNKFNNVLNNRILIIPTPSASKSFRRRGRKHVDPVAKIVARNLNNSGIPAIFSSPLKMNSFVSNKSVQTSGSSGRAARALNAFVVKKNILSKTDHPIFAIVVDDIVTTGSTMNSCVRTLNDSGIRVLAGFSLAAVSDTRDDET